jgi:hypothetical protein
MNENQNGLNPKLERIDAELYWLCGLHSGGLLTDKDDAKIVLRIKSLRELRKGTRP